MESGALVTLPQRERALEGLADVSLEGSRVTTGREWFFFSFPRMLCLLASSEARSPVRWAV